MCLMYLRACPICAQVAVNRSRLRGVVEELQQDYPRQREAAQRQEEGIEFARQYHNVRATPLTLAHALCTLHICCKHSCFICLLASLPRTDQLATAAYTSKLLCSDLSRCITRCACPAEDEGAEEGCKEREAGGGCARRAQRGAGCNAHLASPGCQPPARRARGHSHPRLAGVLFEAITCGHNTLEEVCSPTDLFRANALSS